MSRYARRPQLKGKALRVHPFEGNNLIGKRILGWQQMSSNELLEYVG